MRWILCVPQIIETTDGRSRDQVIQDLVAQNIIRGAADSFTLEPITEWCGDDIKIDVGKDS